MRFQVTMALVVGSATTAMAQQVSSSANPLNLAQVSPAFGRNGGGGIRYVTRPTPTAASANAAQGFFTAAGLNLGAPANPGSAVGGNPGAAVAGPVVIAGGGKAAPSAIPPEAELRRLAQAANQGNKTAQARLAEIGRAMIAQAEATPAGVNPTSSSTGAKVSGARR